MTERECPGALPSISALRELFGTLGDRRILCLGDAMLDVEVDCSAVRISPEAPVMVVEEGEHDHRLGGAANVAANVASLGAATVLAGTMGSDEESSILCDLLDRAGVENCLLRDAGPSRPTTRKTRFLAHGQQLLRLDRECRNPITDDEARTLIDRAISAPVDVVLLSDYGKGVVTKELVALLLAQSGAQGVPVLVDPKGGAWCDYGKVALIKPNCSELSSYTGLPCGDDHQVEHALFCALDRCEADSILVTRAGAGASLLSRGDETARHFHPYEVEVADVCGAGDTNLAALAVGLAGGWSLPEAARLAQLASSLAVQRQGTAVISAHDLLVSHGITAAMEAAQVWGVEEITDKIDVWRRQGLRIGFTNGCFDLIHPGHIHSLEFVRSHCDRLVVGLNSDISVKRNKGPSRPIVNEDDRASVLAGLAAVDAVVLFDEDTPEALIASIKPDVLGKGGDYDTSLIAGAEFVSKYGGKVLVTDFVAGRSTSNIVQAIVRQAGGTPTAKIDQPGGNG